MVKKTYLKSVFRTAMKNKGRFLANFFTVFFSIAITGGLGATPHVLNESFSAIYSQGNAPDIIVKSKASTGFTQSQIETLSHADGISDSFSFYSFDFAENDGVYNRFYIYDISNMNLAKPQLIDGKMPESNKEVLLEKPTKNRRDYHIGDTFNFSALSMFSGGEVTVCGIVDSPLYNSVARERAELEDENDIQYVDAIFYLDQTTLPKYMQGLRNNMYLQMDYSGKRYVPGAYDARAEEVAKSVEQTMGADKVAALTLKQTTSYALFHNANHKVELIGYIFPAFFVALCALITHITITRFIKEERPLIATMMSLGEPKGRVAMKYVSFIGTSVVTGAAIGLAIGTAFVPIILQPAYEAIYQLAAPTITYNVPFVFIIATVLTALSIFISLVSSLKYLREEPSTLVQAQAPVAGKKILLERIPFIWKHLSFSIKSMFRNIFRQKKNLVLTSLSVGGATLLVVLGFALLNVSASLTNDDIFSDVAGSMGPISALIVLFAVTMTILVLYALANMNVADREREIATLKVIGYHDVECALYTSREILFISALACLISLPISAGVTQIVLKFLAFGSIKDVRWWSYLSAFGIVFSTAVIANFVLYPRIKSIDMNTSLKTLE